MIEFPSFDSLYDEFKEQVIADSKKQLNDFTPGSRLDSFAAVSATAAQQVMRYIGKIITSFFIETAAGTDLDRILKDRFPNLPWLRRKPGESDEELRNRVYAYLAIGSRGTLASLIYFIQVVKSNMINNGRVVENYPKGRIEINGEWKSGLDPIIQLKTLEYELDFWRPAGVFIDIQIKEATN